MARRWLCAGTDFERVRQLDRWWSVSKWPADSTLFAADTRGPDTETPISRARDAREMGRSAIRGNGSRGFDSSPARSTGAGSSFAEESAIGA